MSSDGFQITIPDFDDEEFTSTPIPFGRSAGSSPFAFGAAARAPDSPAASTPLMSSDRSYFGSHARGDSITSQDSAHSVNTRYTRSGTPFAHSSQPSFGAASTPAPITKKGSFASIRNAFKTGKIGNNNNEPPPVPQIDHQAYPVLRNPFNRSNSSLPQANSRIATIGSPINAFGRPSTPRTHSKAHHSQTGSVFHNSDAGSDYGLSNSYTESPPPVPRVPNGVGAHMGRSETPPLFDQDDDKGIMDPKTPSEYALHAVFIRFAAAAEAKIDSFLRRPMDQETLLQDIMGPGIDPPFDDILQSIGKIGQKHAKAVVDCLFRWRRDQEESGGVDVLRFHMTSSPAPNRSLGNSRAIDIPSLLIERKSLASIYLVCRALDAVLKTIPKDALTERLGHDLQKNMFSQFRKPDLKLLATSANHRINAEFYATLLGYIANVRFISVTDSFLTELKPISTGQIPKDLDMKYENLIKGLRHVQIKVWPTEAFDEGAEFLESLSKLFAHAHGSRLKIAFAETLVHLLHPIGKTAQVETNDPTWRKAIEIIYPKARDMMAKPRYWQCAYPLVITSLCVAPQDYFLKNWHACFEMSFAKLKEKIYRIPILNGILRLLWTYLYRCQESASSTTTKMEAICKLFFPANRPSIFPHEDQLEPFVYIVHFLLSRHVEYGRELCLELISESAIARVAGTTMTSVSPERTAIAMQAMLLSLNVLEREETRPTWPSGTDFSVLPGREDYPSSAEFMPPLLLSKPGTQTFFDRTAAALAVIASSCAAAVGQMSVFDEQWAYQRIPSYEETHDLIIRKHAEGTVAYPSQLVSQINLLQTCFQSWPRFLHSTLPLGEAIDMMIWAILHVEPSISEAAGLALQRFMSDPSHALEVLARYTAYLFNPTHILNEGSGFRLLVESSQLLQLWLKLVDGWIRNILKQEPASLSADISIIIERSRELESGALFLLSHETWSIHAVGVKAIRILGLLSAHLFPVESVDDISEQPLQTIELMEGKGTDKSYLQGFDDLLDPAGLARLVQWRESPRIDIPLRIADSDNPNDRVIWGHVLPALMQSLMDNSSPVLTSFRESIVAATTRYSPLMSYIAGISKSSPAGLPKNSQQSERDGSRLVKDYRNLIQQWNIWVKFLCSTAVVQEARPPISQLTNREHSRMASGTNVEWERFSTVRWLFRHLTPFLDSEHNCFRDAAVICISSFPANAYPHLLELLQNADRQFYGDARSKAGQTVETLNHLSPRQPAADRNRRQEILRSAVAQIYFLTSQLLQQQRPAGRQTALSHVLKFVRSTHAFLGASETRENYTLQRLRRYFCGTVERLFDGLATLKDSDRIITASMHVNLYRLCEEWCQFGPQADAVKQRLVIMQRAAAAGPGQDGVEKFQIETKLLSTAAVGALSSLCQKAFFPPKQNSGSPIDVVPMEHVKPLDATTILERFGAILASMDVSTRNRGKKALSSLLSFNAKDHILQDESLRRAIVMTESVDTSNARFFEVVSGIICNVEDHGFTFSQVVCLGLSNLCHPAASLRSQAINMLEIIHHQSHGIQSMSQYESMVGSSASSTSLLTHRLVAEVLAQEHPYEALHILIQMDSWLSLLRDSASKHQVALLLLQSLEYWIPNLDLMTDDKTELSRDGLTALYHLMSLTLHHAQTHTAQILALWTQLVQQPHEANALATIRFLLEQSHKVGSTVYVSCAANIVAALCQTVMGRAVYTELCSVIVAARMLPTIEHKLEFPNPEDMELWSDLDALFAEQPRLPLAAAQFAFLFLVDVSPQRQWRLQAQLPALLHAIFTHLDHRLPFVRQQAQKMLFQILRSWTAGYDDFSERHNYPSRPVLKSTIAKLELDAAGMYWKDDETNVDAVPKMRSLSAQVLTILEPLCPGLADRWGTLALNWGTTCSIRATAFRSLQIFRALDIRVTEADFAHLLGRLSNTMAAPTENIQSFTSEILLTLNALASITDLSTSLLSRMFWCACACLSTTVEKEYVQSLEFLQSLLQKLDLDNLETVELLLSYQPPDWSGPAYIQPGLLAGLRSSASSATAFKILQSLTSIDDELLIDPTDGRVRDMYTISLPWCLHAMVTDTRDQALVDFAGNIGRLAQQEGRHSIHKIMTSFVKGAFRTKDDFLRQSVVSLREHYGGDHWTEVTTLLLGLVLNQERWLRVQSMQVLKVLFQQRETINPLDLLGSELLMPLLRLLDTDLATQALEVLEEPMMISGGPAAKHVLRMSMHSSSMPNISELVADIFGVPEPSGWSVARPEIRRATCRSNLREVFDTCNIASRPSQIDFEPEIDALAELPQHEDLGGLVQNLHDLTNFFQDDDDNDESKMTEPSPIPSEKLEARVAAILAKSSSFGSLEEVPHSPFLDVFRVGGGEPDSDDSNSDDSDTDSELDAFIFDSPSVYRSAPNGHKIP